VVRAYTTRCTSQWAPPGRWPARLGRALAVALFLVAFAFVAYAQDAPAQAAIPDAPAPRDTFFEHSSTAKWWVSGQANFVFQTHGDFYAAYSGTNSLHDTAEHATSRVLTLFTGYEFTPNSILYLDVEEAGWGGISGALGLAGFTNLDVVRNPQLGAQPYIARLMFEQIIPFSKEKIEIPRGSLTLATQLPARRLEIRFGKFSMADFFDNNVGGSDSHYQFLNWTAANNGAWDYAADTRGYTVGAILDYEDRNWGLRFAEALMPKIANGPNLDADVARARAENIELELRYKLLKNKDTSIRFLNFVNHANMGTYRDAIAIYEANPTQPPDITATRKQGTIKYGFGINFQQEFTSDVWAFGRWGWNEGQHESFAYTEADSTLQLGVYAKGTRWHRSLDRLGATFISNGIGADHQHYLADGGLGFILGDGGLNYGRETIEEVFYTIHAWRGLYFAVDYQHINNPGYNRDRGPVSVPGLRLHLEF
jgi:high affinity Mn2+ porin